ncbi:imidazolonepropionase [Sphingobacterium sp.]|uniref:imidazolonepropionase n=1 Tax=Sphingobacterium sp. TaxID=341027 RepID=UPI00289BFC0D|nr:imidazolonepropionase [Sphingobacterium sp.]
MEKKLKLIGPFRQLLPMSNMPLKGAIHDKQLPIIEEGGILIADNTILDVAVFDQLEQKWGEHATRIHIAGDQVALPGFIDCHTHIAFAGNRANDFALRNAGSSYLEIAAAGGGIWSTVAHTRACKQEELVDLTIQRANFLLRQGITTIEVKSGYGLNVEEELKILRAIQESNRRTAADLIPTCLAAHMLPRDFSGSAQEYLHQIAEVLFPRLKSEQLSNRIDAFIEASAFQGEEILPYLQKAKEMGFDLTIHADQFTTSGSQIAVELGAKSADHLEASTAVEIELIAHSDTVAVALPAASIGLGCGFTPARKLLDSGACLAIGSDWNPGSAPMGQLLTSASILATVEKLSNAELLAALTYRAAKALNLSDRGTLTEGMRADFSLFKTDNYQNITYYQGSMQPQAVWKDGVEVFSI